MPEHDDEWRAEMLHRILHGADREIVGDVAGDAHGEDVAEALIEQDLRRDPRIRAAQHDGKGHLTACHGLSAAGMIEAEGLARDVSAIAGDQPLARGLARDRGGGSGEDFPAEAAPDHGREGERRHKPASR